MKISHRIARWLARAAQLPLPQYSSQGGFLTQLNLHNLDLHPIPDKTAQLDNYVGWVYACVQTIAQDIRVNPWNLWFKAGERKEDWEAVEESKLPQVFKRPNTIDQTWGQLIERRNLHKDTTGEAWWHLITTRPGGRILGIEMIQPDEVKEPLYDAGRTTIVGWKIEQDNQPVNTIDARDIVMDFYPSPKDKLRGASPIEAFALAHHLDLYLRAYGVKMVRDGALVTQYVTTDQEMSKEQAAAAEEGLNRKYRTPGRLAVLGKGATLETPGIPLKDLAFLDILKPSREQVLAVYKMPASILGVVEDSNRANMEASRRNYQRNALQGRLFTADQIVNGLLPRILENPEQYAYESENPVEEDRTQVFNEALKELQAGAIKVNQFHQRVGNQDQGDEGEVYFIPNTVTIVRSLSGVADQPAEPVAPTPQPPTDNADALDQAAKNIALLVEPLFSREVEELRRRLAAERRSAASERWLRAQDNLERKAKSRIREQFSRDLREMKKRLEQNYRGAESIGLRGVNVALTRDWIDDAVNAGSDAWKVLIEATLTESIRTGWLLFQSEVAGGLDFAMFEQQAVEYARRLAAEQIAEIDATTADAVRELTAQGIENGWSIQEMSRKLSELYDGFKGTRAEVIARTETATSMNWGKYQASIETSRRLGMTLEREWIAVEDSRTRPTHMAADGQRIGLNETYLVGGFTARFPGDPNLPPGEVINCRCVEVFRDVSE